MYIRKLFYQTRAERRALRWSAGSVFLGTDPLRQRGDERVDVRGFSRWQLGVTAVYHFLFVQDAVGMSPRLHVACR